MNNVEINENDFALKNLPDIDVAKMMLAEIHYILQLKEKNHHIGIGEKDLLGFSKPYYEELSDKLDREKIEFEIARCRMTDDKPRFQVNGEVISYYNVFYAKYVVSKNH